MNWIQAQESDERMHEHWLKTHRCWSLRNLFYSFAHSRRSSPLSYRKTSGDLLLLPRKALFWHLFLQASPQAVWYSDFVAFHQVSKFSWRMLYSMDHSPQFGWELLDIRRSIQIWSGEIHFDLHHCTLLHNVSVSLMPALLFQNQDRQQHFSFLKIGKNREAVWSLVDTVRANLLWSCWSLCDQGLCKSLWSGLMIEWRRMWKWSPWIEW